MIKDKTLKVEGTGGQHVLYDGFVKLKVSFPDDVVGASNELESLALVQGSKYVENGHSGYEEVTMSSIVQDRLTVLNNFLHYHLIKFF